MTKEQLRKYQSIKRERDQLLRQIEAIEAALYYPKPQQISGMPSAPSKGNALEDMSIKHIELQERYREKAEELAAMQMDIETAIDSLDPVERIVLRCHYIEGMTWEETCVASSYSWRQVHRIHSRALKKLEEKE